jgi:hypothetical protein
MPSGKILPELNNGHCQARLVLDIERSTIDKVREKNDNRTESTR